MMTSEEIVKSTTELKSALEAHYLLDVPDREEVRECMERVVRILRKCGFMGI